MRGGRCGLSRRWQQWRASRENELSGHEAAREAASLTPNPRVHDTAPRVCGGVHRSRRAETHRTCAATTLTVQTAAGVGPHTPTRGSVGAAGRARAPRSGPPAPTDGRGEGDTTRNHHGSAWGRALGSRRAHPPCLAT